MLEVVEGGQVNKVISSLSDTVKGLSAGGGVNQLLSLFSIKGEGHFKKSNNNVIDKKVTSTILSNFMDKINSGNINVIKHNDVKLTIPVKSTAYYRNLLPALQLIGDRLPIDNTQDGYPTSISVDNIMSGFDSLFSYYEFLGEKNSEKMVFRFNIEGLKNNYTLYDLTVMTNLTFFSVKVGETSTINLTLEDQLSNITGERPQATKTRQYEDLIKEINSTENGSNKDEGDATQTFAIYDVLLAGVQMDEN